MSESLDWGVPNWLRPEEYPSPEGAGEMAVWAWEFLRRNHRYRKFWTEKFVPFFDGLIWERPNGAKELLADFGLTEPCDPRHAYGDLHFVFAATSTRYRSAPLSIKAALINGHTEHTPILGLRPPTVDNWDKLREAHVGQRFDLSDTEMAFVINLEQPLDSQLRSIERIARRDQQKLTKSGFITVANPRGRGKYVDYLRLLDAIDSGTNRLKIEEKLFPGLDSAYENNQRGKTYNNYLKAAEKLRDGGYKALAAAAF
jgi:hypothetical protein